jgi:hypothetical protein
MLVPEFAVRTAGKLFVEAEPSDAPAGIGAFTGGDMLGYYH